MNISEKMIPIFYRAHQAAMSMNLTYVGSEHLVFALSESDSTAGEILRSHQVDKDAVLLEIAKMNNAQPGPFPQTQIHASELFERFTPRTKRIFFLAEHLGRKMRLPVVLPELLLLAILREGQNTGYRMLGAMGAPIQDIMRDLLEGLSHMIEGSPVLPDDIDGQPERSGEPLSEGPIPQVARAGGKKGSMLEKYGRDLTAMAKEDAFDPIIGREKEINRIMQILARRTKNNPCLVGEPGVGKTAIAEGLAQKIIQADVPELLKKKRVIAIDLASMLAGSKFRGEFEERLKMALEEARKNKDTILFIDEIHNIVGAGSAEGAMDAANILKPLLTRGDMQVIGATTLDEYRKRIEKDSALERRFQQVRVDEPSTADAVLILKGIRSKYEDHHRIQIPDEAVDAAVILSSRYITDRFLPDKAIDLIDEAASRLRLQTVEETPEEKRLGERIEEIVRIKKESVDRQDFETAQKLRDEEVDLEKRMEQIRAGRSGNKEKRAALTVDDIADIVAEWTGIPVSKINETDAHKLKTLEDDLKKRVVGQDEAVQSVAKAIRRSRLGLKDPKRPSGSFIFLGTTGVGKTELARALAELMFGNEEALIRVDMSEYMEKHDAAKLIGSPPGYVGYEDGGQLTEKVRRRPYSVVLFDEIEKAHPEIFNAMLQILDDGRLTDGQGRTVDFRNTIIIMTSNIGARLLTNTFGRKIGFSAPSGAKGQNGDVDEASVDHLYGGKTYDEAKRAVLDELKKTFNPEFINRIDEIIFFRMLSKAALITIVDMLLKSLSKRVLDIGVELKITDKAKELLAEKGYDPQYGARPLKRTIQSMVEDVFSEALLDQKIMPGDIVIADQKDDVIVIEKETKKRATKARPKK